MTLFSFVNDIVTTVTLLAVLLNAGGGGRGGYSKKTNIADFPTLFTTEFRFLIPCLRHAVTSCVAFLLCNQWEFNVPGIHAKVNGSQY